MSDLGRILIVAGFVLLTAGGVVLLLGRGHLPLGRLPGDVFWRGGNGRGRNWTFYFPIVSCLVVSALLSFVLWIAGRLRR